MSEHEYEEPSLQKRLHDAVAALQEATEQHAKAKERARAVSSDEVRAHNWLNKAQQEFDVVVAEIRKAAPQGSDWHEQQRTGVYRVPLTVKAGEE